MYPKTAMKGDYDKIFYEMAGIRDNDKFMDEISRNKVADNRSTNKGV